MSLIWSLPARRDLDAIADHYGQFDPDLPQRLLNKIVVAPLLLLDRPRLGPAIPDGTTRVWRAKGTPLLLLYRIVGDKIEIVAVRHTASDWKPRD